MLSRDDREMSQAIEASLHFEMANNGYDEAPLEDRVRIGHRWVVVSIFILNSLYALVQWLYGRHCIQCLMLRFSCMLCSSSPRFGIPSQDGDQRHHITMNSIPSLCLRLKAVQVGFFRSLCSISSLIMEFE